MRNLALDGDPLHQIRIRLHGDGAETSHLCVPCHGLIADIGEFDNELPWLARDDEVAVLVAHAPGDEGGVLWCEERHVDVRQWLSVFIDDASCQLGLCLLHAFHIYVSVL